MALVAGAGERVVAGSVTGTVDRAGLLQVAAPLVVPPAHAGRLHGDDLVVMAQALAAVTEVVPVEVPVAARRLSDDTERRVVALRHGS